MLTITIKIMTVMRKKPEITWRVKEGFTEVAILKYGHELTNNEIIMKHWKHSGHPSGHTVDYGTPTWWDTTQPLQWDVERGPSCAV